MHGTANKNRKREAPVRMEEVGVNQIGSNQCVSRMIEDICSLTLVRLGEKGTGCLSIWHLDKFATTSKTDTLWAYKAVGYLQFISPTPSKTSSQH